MTTVDLEEKRIGLVQAIPRTIVKVTTVVFGAPNSKEEAYSFRFSPTSAVLDAATSF